MIYPVVRELAGDGVPVATACRVLKLSTSGFYDWERRGPSSPDLDQAHLMQARVAFEQQPQQRCPVVVGEHSGNVDEVARNAATDHRTDLRRDGVVAVEDEADAHPHGRVRPPVSSEVYDDGTLGVRDVQPGELAVRCYLGRHDVAERLKR